MTAREFGSRRAATWSWCVLLSKNKDRMWKSPGSPLQGTVCWGTLIPGSLKEKPSCLSCQHLALLPAWGHLFSLFPCQPWRSEKFRCSLLPKGYDLGSLSITSYNQTCFLRISILRWISHNFLLFPDFKVIVYFCYLEHLCVSWKIRHRVLGQVHQLKCFGSLLCVERWYSLRFWASKCTSFITWHHLFDSLLPIPPSPITWPHHHRYSCGSSGVRLQTAYFIIMMMTGPSLTHV